MKTPRWKEFTRERLNEVAYGRGKQRICFQLEFSFSLEPWSPGMYIVLQYWFHHPSRGPAFSVLLQSFMMYSWSLDGGRNPQWVGSNSLSCSCPQRMGLRAFSRRGKQQLCSRYICAANEVWPDAEGLQYSSPSLAPAEVTPPSFNIQIITVASLPLCYLYPSIHFLYYSQTLSLVAQMAKNLPAMQETRVWSLGWEDALEKEMATHSSILAWRI